VIIIINGPLGIGKTQTSWALVRRFPRAVMLDADYVAEFHPFDYYNDEHLAYAHATLRVLAGHHHSHGFEHFVINWIFESPFQLERLRGLLADLGLPIYAFRLVCAPKEIERRVRRRNLPDLEYELRRSRELIQILDAAALTGDIGTPLDTTNLTPDQAADAILHQIQGVAAQNRSANNANLHE
jgi:broad-specificity NMP kinase